MTKKFKLITKGKTLQEIVAELNSISSDIDFLDLTGNSLADQSSAEFEQILATIPLHVTVLDLSWNRFGYEKNNPKLIQMLAAIPKHIISIFFRGNYLQEKTIQELIPLLAAFPDHLISIDLEGNKLSERHSSELKQVFVHCFSNLQILGVEWPIFSKLFWMIEDAESFKLAISFFNSIRDYHISKNKFLLQNNLFRAAHDLFLSNVLKKYFDFFVLDSNDMRKIMGQLLDFITAEAMFVIAPYIRTNQALFVTFLLKSNLSNPEYNAYFYAILKNIQVDDMSTLSQPINGETLKRIAIIEMNQSPSLDRTSELYFFNKLSRNRVKSEEDQHYYDCARGLIPVPN